jgi:hypothetical protein
MKTLLGIATMCTGAALLAAPSLAQAQMLPADALSAYRQGNSGVVMVAPRANVSGTPDSAFPYAAPHEIRYINGVACRTILQNNGVRVPVACVGASS